jgi:hypothetical protein
MARQQGNIAGVYDPDVVLTQKGGLIGSDGTDPGEIVPGPDGHVLVYDSTQPYGIGHQAIDPAAQNVTNAANRSLFRLGM